MLAFLLFAWPYTITNKTKEGAWLIITNPSWKWDRTGGLFLINSIIFVVKSSDGESNSETKLRS